MKTSKQTQKNDPPGGHQTQEDSSVLKPVDVNEKHAAESLTQVRELLFGQQQRLQQNALEALSQRMDDSLTKLSERWTERMDQLDQKIEQRLERLSDEVAAERQERGQALKASAASSKSSMEALDNRMREEFQSLGQDLQSANAKSSGEFAAIRKNLDSAQEAAMERNKLADFVSDLANKLRGAEQGLPGSE